jgi:YVTN family beta-propeller protein
MSFSFGALRARMIALAALPLTVGVLISCTSAYDNPASPAAPSSGGPSTAVTSSGPAASPSLGGILPGMPPPLDPGDIYAGDRPGQLAAQVRHQRSLVYVPNFGSGTVSVIDPNTFKVIHTKHVGKGPQHIVPSWDLKTLWVNNNSGNSLIPINPETGSFGKPVTVQDPYNLYFTPDGRFAMVMAEMKQAIVFRDPHTMAVKHVLPVGCDGVNHADFSRDGRYFIVTCEFSGDLVKIDTARQQIVARMRLPGSHPMPQDIKISPDGRIWYIADMMTNGVWVLDGDAFTKPSFVHTGAGAHGLYPSRDSRYLYVANRGEGTISLIAFGTRKVARTWRIPGHASPDMGGVSANGKVLWLSGRYDREVYAIDTATGHLLARIKVGTEPHGLCVWPQPGRYSLGHTGILR